MKAIVVRQPWATLIALGVKTIETRPFPPNGSMRPEGVRGLPGCSLGRGERIAIVAGKQRLEQATVGAFDVQRADYMGHGEERWVAWRWETPGQSVTATGYDLPLGAVVCTVTVEDALPIFHVGAVLDWAEAGWEIPNPRFTINGLDVLSHAVGNSFARFDDQRPLGDFTPGRWGWLLSDPQPCDPIPVQGTSGCVRAARRPRGGAVVSGICADLGRCAYAAASKAHGDGSVPDACPFWMDCFGLVPATPNPPPRYCKLMYVGGCARLAEPCKDTCTQHAKDGDQ